jgi:hypothetical protein
MPKVRVSVKQRPPIRSLASNNANLRPVGTRRRAAAIPAAPAPTMTTSTSGCGAGAASTGRAAAAAEAAEAARNERRLNAGMVSGRLTAARACPNDAIAANGAVVI